MSARFAFIIHPIDPQRDVARKFPRLGQLPVWAIDFLSLFFPPVFISEIKGVTSTLDGRTVSGWFVACPLTPKRMLSLPPAVVYRKIIQTGKLAERLGADILGLGAFTSVVGDGGITIARHLRIPVTTGDSYTVAVAVEAIRAAARQMGIALDRATLAIVGAGGAIGAVCATLLAPEVKKLLLIGRQPEKLAAVAANARAAGVPEVETATTVARLVEAQLIITVTSALEAIIEPEHLRPGAVICDVARPRDVSRQVAEQRQDVLVIEGGMVAVPGPVDFGFDFGFPPGMAYACMAETMALTLEGQLTSFTIGKMVQLSQVQTIAKIAYRHGFRLGGFRSFERAISDTEIAAVKQRANII
jgi:fatty aldehyde-generating acyl-ACP reductase